MNECPRCGQPLSPSDPFCPACGLQLHEILRPAGFLIRLAAYIIDAVLLYAYSIIALRLLPDGLTALFVLGTPELVYKPLMEWRFGATVGKLACGVQVVDEAGRRIGLGTAYMRFMPFLLLSLIGIANAVWLSHAPGATGPLKPEALFRLLQESPIMPVLIGWFFVLVGDCGGMLFTPRKRALHDVIAGTFCVHRVPVGQSHSVLY